MVSEESMLMHLVEQERGILQKKAQYSTIFVGMDFNVGMFNS